MPLSELAVAGWKPACRQFILISTFVSTWCSPYGHFSVQIYPFYKDTSHVGLWPTLIQYNFILSNYISMTLFQNEVIF